MFGNIKALTDQFTPVSGGYLYYPSPRSGGKHVTADEYRNLVARWQEIAGTRGILTITGIGFLWIVVWTLLSEALELPDWSHGVGVATCVAGVIGRVLWFSLAPMRLVRGRPDIAPPRPVSQARREARAVLSWPFAIFALLISGAVFAGKLSSFDDTLNSWAWVVGSGLFSGAYLWIAIQKLVDRYR